MSTIGVFGGTFDPVHRGHIEIARYVNNTLNLNHVRFVLSARPPHRSSPIASIEHRSQMLRAAIQNESGFCEDERECQRPGPSYMVWTLRALRAEKPKNSLALIIGADAFVMLDTWFHWEQILTLTHLIVLPRSGWSVSELAHTWYRGPMSVDPSELHRSTAGQVLFCDAPRVDVSASAIREKIAAGQDVASDIPDVVWIYIREHGLYGYSTRSKKHAI